MSREPRHRRSSRTRRGGARSGSSGHGVAPVRTSTLTLLPAPTAALPCAFVLAPLLALVLTFGAAVGIPSFAHADAGSRNEAIAQALAQSGGAGKVLGVKEERDARGGVVYAVKVLTDGRVRIVRIRGR